MIDNPTRCSPSMGHPAMIRSSAVHPALVLCIAFIACDADGEPASSTVRDSAGVRIVEHQALDAPPWWLSAEPVLVLGTLEGEDAQQLYSAEHALRRADGGIIVANQGTQEVRFFGPGGEHIRTVGGGGGGPGEFERMWGMVRVAADSLAVWDPTAKRLTLYDAEGTVGRMVTAEVAGFSPVLIGALDDHHVAVIDGLDAIAVFSTRTGVRDDSATVLKVDIRSGAIADTLGPYPAGQQYVNVSETMFWMKNVVFGRKRLVDAAAGRVHVGDDRTGEVRSYDPEGRLVGILRAGGEPLPVTSAAERAYRARILEEAQEDRRAEERRRLAETPTAERFPSFDELFVDPVGRLWIRAFDPDLGGTRRWVIFHEDGRAAGRVDLPERFQPLDAGPDYVLFRTRDELDVERLVMFELRGSAEEP